MTKIYRVDIELHEKHEQFVYLVRAESAAQARAHVLSACSVRQAKQADMLLAVGSDGLVIQDAVVNE